MTRVARRAWIDVGSINWHPLTGTRADAVGGSWNGKVLVDLPYFNRTSKAPPSHYTICAKYNPLAAAYPSPHQTLMLGESVTVMGEDQYGKAVQFDFIAAIWPGVNYSAFGSKWNGDMTNGHWSGGTWVPRTQSNGQQDQGVTCEEWDTGLFFHSNTHRVPPGMYQPPLPPIGHPVQPPTIFGYSGGDKHIYAVWGLYDCRAEDIPADENYLPIMKDDVLVKINASYDTNDGSDIRSGGNPIPFEVRARIVPQSGYVADSPAGGNFPAAYLVAADPGIVANVSYLAPALDPMSAAVTTLISGGNFNPVDGTALNPGTTSLSDAERGMDLSIENTQQQSGSQNSYTGWEPAPPVSSARGEAITVTAPVNTGTNASRMYIYNIDGTLVFRDDYGNLVDQQNGNGRNVRISPPEPGQVIAVGIDATGAQRVDSTRQQTVAGPVESYSLINAPENPEVVVDVPEEDPADPTDTPDDTELESSENTGAGDPEQDDGDTSNWGNGGGSNWGNGPGDFSGGGGGPDGGDGMGGDADI